MREAHAHIFQLGRSLTMLDVGGATSGEELLELVAERSRSVGEGEWILAHSARPEGWSDPSWPTIGELDRASGGRAVCVWCFDYHSMFASSEALRIAKIDSSTTIDRGIIGTDDDGRVNGVLYEHAALTLWESIPEPGIDQRRAMVRSAGAHLAKLGFTEVHDLKAQSWLGPVIHELRGSGEFGLDVTLFPLVKDLEATLATRSEWESGSLILGGTKIFTDGALNSRTAWMLEPYLDRETRGTPMMTSDEIDHAMVVSKEHGLPVAAHAIGDAAVRGVLDSIERTGCANMGARIEHLELVHPDDLGRFVELGMIASVQPCHLLPDMEVLGSALHDRLDRVLPLRSLLSSGLVAGESMMFGSDVPIVRADHGDSIQAAVHRRREGMDESEAINFEERLSESESMRCFNA